MKKSILLVLAALGCINSFSQVGGPQKTIQPATWSFSVSKSAIKVGDELEVVLQATIPDNWYMYSNQFEAEGPTKTEFLFVYDSCMLLDTMQAINPIVKQDEIFGGEVKIFKKKAEFRQKIKIWGGQPTLALTDVYYQLCSDVSGQCVMFNNVKFDFSGLLKPTAK